MYNLFDSHTHSENSFDGVHSVTFMAETAQKKGLMGFSVTDHCEVNLFRQDRYDVRLRQSYFSALKAKAVFASWMTITAGIELGQPLQNQPLAEKILQAYPFDFVIGSLHNPKGQEDYYFMKFSEMTMEEIVRSLEQYFREILAMVHWGKFDVLGHLTYPLRYIQGRDSIPVALEPFDGLVEEIFKALIDKGLGLEANTSGYRQNMNGPIPSLRYLKRYRELGGEIITLGSDSHTASDIGANIEGGMELLKTAGFSHFTIYKDRKPRMFDLY